MEKKRNISLDSLSYFFGRISRSECETILRRQGCDVGLFLLREKLESPGSYVLSICVHNSCIFHYKLDKATKLNNGPVLDGPVEYVKYFCSSKSPLSVKPTMKCERFENTMPVYYLFVDTNSFLDVVKKQIELRCKPDDFADAWGKYRNKYERFALRDLHLPQRWFRINTKKRLAEEIFQEKGYIDGKFMLRSTNVYLKPSYKLTVCFNRQIHHYKILFENGRYSIEGGVGTDFEFLIQLVDYYGRQKGCLHHCLTTPYDINVALKPSVNYFCDTNNNYLAFITNNENLVRKITKEFTLENLTEKIANLKIVGLIGEGHFSNVYKALHRRSNTLVDSEIAIKVLKERNSSLVDEYEIMKELFHPNIVKILDITENLDENLQYYVIALEYAPIGPLDKYFKTKKRNSINPMTILNYILQVLSALVYISSKRLVHRDIAARNVLLFTPEFAKLSDFGLSKKFNDYLYYTSSSKNICPIKYTAPEVIIYKKYSEKSDVWGFGVFLWELYTHGSVPFPMIMIRNDADANNFIQNICNGNLKLEIPEECPREIAAIIESCWKIDSKERPKFTEIMDKIDTLLNPYAIEEESFL